MCESPRCPKCGIPLPADAPAGLCPKCLVQAGFESEPVPQPNPAPTVLTPPSSGFEPPSVEELAGKFPQLEILELLGKGGMGAVYKARQRGLDRLVAVKILPPEIGLDPAFAERFTREARALARLSHSHIVSVYDFGQTRSGIRENSEGQTRSGVREDSEGTSEFSRIPLRDRPEADGLFYIVMEYVDGVNLRQTIQSGGLSPADALAIVPQICEALQFAHDEGIVHRDIKPENILIDKRGRVKIADFGLAKLLGQDASDHSLTATHQVMGTLRYMAPEQMQGSREVDHRADIYSLGVVFYELLTGELPMGKFAPPSKKVQVDVRLDEIVLRALEQDPEQRYQHASEMKSGIETITGDSIRGDSNARSPASAPRSWERHPAGISTIVERELHGAWRWVAGDSVSPTQAPAFPGRLMILLSLAGCLMLMVPWVDLHIEKDANVRQFWSNAELPGSFSQTLYGFELWPGIAAGVALGLLTLLLIMTPVRRPLTWQRAAVMSVIAAYAVLHTFLFKLEFENGKFTIPIILHEYARPAGQSGAGSDSQVVSERRMEPVTQQGSVPLRSIEHRVKYREGFYGSLGLSVVLLVLSGIGVRHAVARGGEKKTVTDPGSWPVDGLPQIRRQLKGPAIALMLYGLIVLFPAALCFSMGFSMLGHDPIPAATCFGMIALSFLLLGLSGLLLRGGWHMLALESYRAAFLASFLGQPIGIWGLFVLSRPDVKAAFQAQASSQRTAETPTGTGPGSWIGTPLTQIRFVVSDARDVARQAIFHFSTLGYRLIEQRPDVCVFQRGRKWAGLWDTDIRGLHTILSVRTAPAADGALWVSCDWSIRTFGAGISRRDIAKLEAEGRGLESLLGGGVAGVGDQPQPENPPIGIGRISLWSAIAGVVLPVLLALGAYWFEPFQRLADFVVLCVVFGGLLELVALGCGIVARRTGSGKAGILIACVSLLLGLLVTPTHRVSVSPSEVEEKTERAVPFRPKTGDEWFGDKGAEFVLLWGPNSPTVSDRLDQHLGLFPVQREAMNQAFQRFFREFRALEEQNTRHETDANGHQISTITAFQQPLTELGERFWSELESSLDGRQLALGRRVVHLRNGLFESGDFGYRIEIWRVGQINPWYHWTASYPGVSTPPQIYNLSSSGPELPENLRRFWTEPTTDDAKNLKH